MNPSVVAVVVALTFLGGHSTQGSPLEVNADLYRGLAEGRADASEYMDMVLANVRVLMTQLGLGNLALPNATVGFEQVVGGINWHGEASLSEGSLLNVDTLHRTGKAEIAVEESGDLVISAEVGVNEGTLHYAVDVTFMDLGPHAVAEGTLSSVRLLMTLRVREDNIAHLETFDIKSTGHLSLDVKGLGAVLNFLIEILGEFVGNLVKGVVAALLEGPIKNIVNEIISSIRFPPDAFRTIVAAYQPLNAPLPN